MTRIHLSKNDHLITELNYIQKEAFIKPFGLWYSLNNEWKQWCEGNMPEWTYNHAYEIDVDMKNVLVIENLKDINYFDKKYLINPPNLPKHINWDEVVKNYDGMEVRNYHKLKWSNDISIWSIWFSAWDVNGGCIWNLECIKNIKKL